MLCICQLAIAQTKNFQGVVKDAKGNTLPGVTILETGTSNGVSTNIDGIFEIKLRPGSTLTVILDTLLAPFQLTIKLLF